MPSSLFFFFFLFFFFVLFSCLTCLLADATKPGWGGGKKNLSRVVAENVWAQIPSPSSISLLHTWLGELRVVAVRVVPLGSRVFPREHTLVGTRRQALR